MIEVRISRANFVEFTDNATAMAYTHEKFAAAGIPFVGGLVSDMGSLWMEIDPMSDVVIWRWYNDDEAIPSMTERLH